MAFTDPGTPNLADFITFAEGQGVPSADVPTDADAVFQPQWALSDAQDRVIGQTSVGSTPLYMRYVLAVYNLALHLWITQGGDLPGQTFFQSSRAAFNLNSFLGGVILASGDEGTSNTIMVPEFLKGMTMDDLDLIKTPWGRQYMGYAQMYGPNAVTLV